jgi:hypothetical protein
VPPGAVPPPDGWVVAFGAGEPAGSAAFTTATPPTTRRPTARSAVAATRRMPPRLWMGSWPRPPAVPAKAGGAGAKAGAAGSLAGWSYQGMS